MPGPLPSSSHSKFLQLHKGAPRPPTASFTGTSSASSTAPTVTSTTTTAASAAAAGAGFDPAADASAGAAAAAAAAAAERAPDVSGVASEMMRAQPVDPYAFGMGGDPGGP
ncbi:uncharacterized protein EMH_0000790 [Eimeria mitis]|uniref:Uncharacterized protein n=1 Tax=Eimeria mitis TaxID=44415 RepID=U6KI07_9EIME|nr:uncharacterized protein EMH_0000790 [Eimeria mitis]CDJ35867.1 hypothetical protein EMH_0000790 [Eimeria mitis]